MLKNDPNYHPRRKAAWYKQTREHNLNRMRLWRRSVHDAALDALGGACRCCGEKRRTMLDIDHINGGGSAERRADNMNNFRLYQRLRDGKAEPGAHQVLCANCNHSKRRNGGMCEHATEQTGEATA